MAPMARVRPAPPPVSGEDKLQQEVDKLAAGEFAYDVPSPVQEGVWTNVKARIGRGTVSVQTLTDGFSSAGKATTTSLPVSTKMKVTLTGPAFDIQEVSPEVQFVDEKTPTTWEWNVRANKRGEQNLRLAAIVELDGASKEYKVIERTVAVQVNPIGQILSFAGANWQWLLSAIGGSGIVGWIISRVRGKGGPKPNTT